MAERVITNPSGAFGYTDLEQTQWRLSAPFLTSAAVATKTVVAIGTDGKVATAATNGTAALAIGVTATAISSGYTGNVVLAGVVTGVTAQGAIAAGDVLKRSATTAGAVAATATPATGEALGVALAASSGGTVTMWVFPGR